jgi:UDP-glucose 4-epimerase
LSVLIVGGAGYIGSQTAKLVAKAGLAPVVLDNLVYGHESAVKWGPLIKGDLADAALVDRVLVEHGVTSVIHFAAYAYVGESVTNPRKYFRNNVVNTLNLLDAMVDRGVRDIVFSSTCATYGEPSKVPISEEHPQSPVNPYGESKLIVEKMLTPDGTAIRDYIHVADLAEAHILALQHLTQGTASLKLNLGTGQGHSVREVISAVEKISGRKVPAREVGRRAGDPPTLVADAKKAREVLGWQAKYAALETIVEHAFRWHSRSSR